ncbi:restriction endonuclease [Streptomyces tendae]|uniref:restriction endonuclease n=1 Tax=Streptomyces tendae TaxID=1932 RepID=UPI00114E9AD0
MTMPERRFRGRSTGRRFDLRATTLAFGLAAVALSVVGWAARMAFDVAQRRPAWALVLVLATVSALLVRRLWRRGRRGSRPVRRTADALATATATALDALEERAAAPEEEDRGTDEEPTAVLPAHQSLTPDEFEEAIAELCRRDGCAEVEVVGGAGDLGADVLALTPDGRRIVVQCKRYGDGNKVGSQDLQRFGGTCFTVHGADVAVLVTSSDFTAPAAEYAERCGIVCVNEERLRDWWEGGGPAPWEVLAPQEDETRPCGRAGW